jgi:hypothetical protein
MSTPDKPWSKIKRRDLMAGGLAAAGAVSIPKLASGQDVNMATPQPDAETLIADVLSGVGDAPMSAELRGQWFNNTHYSWFEFPTEDKSVLEVWGYTDKTSYAPGEIVNLHVSTTADTYDLVITRDGAIEQETFSQAGLPGQWHPTPKDAYRVGAQWPVATQITIPSDWPSGGYIVTLRVQNAAGNTIEQEAFFIVRPQRRTHPIAFVVATTTWQAYSDWGGSNYYEGISGPENNQFSPVTSTLRPWARGFIRLPAGAPRIPINYKVPIGAAPRYENLEYAYARGYSKYSAAAGWASFDRLFAQWAERNGYQLDYFALDDLHRNPDILKGYKTVVMVGHDEYHSRPERLAIDSYVEGGGNLARFGGNLIWHARREGDQLVCYKARAATEDPLRDDPEQITTTWDAQSVNWPIAQTWGVSGTRGIYVKLGGFQPRASGGYTVYRPGHWALANTDLYYGDVFGQEATIVGFEGDGLDYTFRYGLPYPTGEDGASQNIEIIAMGLAGTEEEDHGNFGTYLYAADGDLAFLAKELLGADTEENRAKCRYGSSMVVNMKKGNGEVFCAGTTEWVNGLKERDEFVEIITRNVLDRYKA